MKDYSKYKVSDLPKMKLELDLEIENLEIKIEETRANIKRQEYSLKKKKIDFEKEQALMFQSIEKYHFSIADFENEIKTKHDEITEIEQYLGGE